MCLIITIICAIITTLLYLFKASCKNSNFAALPLFYWGASIMWTIDGVFNLIHKEAFCEISLNDTMLGLLIAVCGVAIFAIYSFVSKNKEKSKKAAV